MAWLPFDPHPRIHPPPPPTQVVEGQAAVLFPTSTRRDVFYNKAQVVNRDLSILVCERGWQRGWGGAWGGVSQG